MESENNIVAGIYIPTEEENSCVGCKYLYAPINGSPCENCLVEEDGIKKWTHRTERNDKNSKS